MRKLTHEEFLNKFYEKNKHAQDIQVVGTYVNANTKIKCKCKLDGHEWTTLPYNLLQGTGCPECAKKRVTQKQTWTHKQFMREFEIRNKHSQYIKILGTYKNGKTKILCKCKKDGYEWKTIPERLLKGKGCPKCAGNAKLTHKEFMEKVNKQNKHAQDIIVVSTYKNNKTSIKCKCKKCGYEWETMPDCLLRGYGCSKCAGNAKLTTKEFINKLKQINPDIEVLGTYINSQTKIKCRCRIDGYEWEAIPNNLVRGGGCPKCSVSKGEKRIAHYLDNLGINYVYDKGYFKNLVGTGGQLLRPDFIIPSLKIWIEYDGEQHHEPVNFRGAMNEQQIQDTFKKVQQNDQIKNQYAKDNNWILVRIPFTEYDNIEQILAAYIAQEQVI